MKYTTQMNAARQGIVTKEMEAVAAYEGIDVKDLMAEVAAGTIVIPANKNHKCLKPFGIGNSLKTKINVNLGTSRDCLNLDVEMEKVNKAVEMGAEAIMDLSSFGHTHVFRKKLVDECPAILGTVPIYDAIVYYNKALKDITSREWIDVFKDPITDAGKKSKKGRFMVIKDLDKIQTVPFNEEIANKNMLKVRDSNGKSFNNVTFSEVRSNSEKN